MATKRRGTRSSTTQARTAADVIEQSTPEYLRRANARLARQLGEARAKSAELVEAVYRAACDAATGLALPPIPPPKRDRRPGQPEVAIVNLSDFQLAKTTPTYNSEVCEERIQLCADKVELLTNIQRSDHPIEECVVNFLGDIVEGELIFPSQAHVIDASLYRQVMIDGPRICGAFLRRMLTIFKRVRVNCVIGNHGALGGVTRRTYNPTTNADRMLYRFLAELFAKDRRITFNIPDRENERDWYIVDYPFGLGKGIPDHGWGFLLLHGDQLNKNPSQWPRRFWGWRSGGIPEPFKYAVFGHWHNVVRMDLNDITIWCNGSTESTNTYAQEKLSAMGKPKQILLFVHPQHGVTAEYDMNLSSVGGLD